MLFDEETKDTTEEPQAEEPQAEAAAAEAPAEEPAAVADAPVEEAPAEEPAAVADAPVEEAPAEEPAAVADAPVEEAPAEEPAAVADAPVEEAPAEEPAAVADAPVEEAPVAEAPTVPAESTATLSSKDARRLARSTHAGEARPPRSTGERQAERLEIRRKKAASRRTRRLKERERHAKGAADRTPTPAREHVVGQAKVRQGIVVSDKADKTITVRVDTARRHRRYHKVVRSSTTFHAHDETNDAHAGDTVKIVESRPLSRTKRWRLIEVLERAK